MKGRNKMSIFDFAYEFPSTIEELDKFNGKDFEVFLFEFFKALGHKVRLTDDTNDKGIDLFVDFKVPGGTKGVGIQAKRWKSKVGANEIRNMLDGKEHYRLDEVWIVTTSDLTSAAITTAMNNNIEIVNRDRVKGFLEELKKVDGVRFKEQKIKKSKQTTKIKNDEHVDETNKSLFEELRKLRAELSQKHKIYPVYLVYNNATIEDLIVKNPENSEELLNVSGITEQKIKLFGEDILEILRTHNNQNENIIEELKTIRKRVMKYNKLKSLDDTFDDVALKELAAKMPTTIEELSTINNFKKDNIELFGDYLIKEIVKLKKL